MNKINSLKELQEKRAGKYSLALNKNSSAQDTREPLLNQATGPLEAKTLNSKNAGIKGSWIPWLFIAIFALVFLVVNLQLIFAMKGYANQRNAAEKKLNTIEALIDNNTKQISAILESAQRLSEDAKVASRKIENIKKGIEGIEKTNDVHAAAIENLTKAKNTLFKKLSSLEATAAKPGE